MSGEGKERNVVMEESNVGAQNSYDTLVVLEFSPKAPAETKEWLTALIKAPVSSGGVGLKTKLLQMP